MKTVLTGLALLALAACNTRSDQETGRVNADTSVTTRQTQDTTIVTRDTSVKVDVDTVKKEGNREVTTDSTKH
jgi:outer membrane biogenesis lipoprotein LolB